jgi:16S rRNA processing protein RimM
MDDDLIELGRAAGAYGFRGWVRVLPFDSGEVLLAAKRWVLIPLAGEKRELAVTAVRRHGKGFVAKWEGCETKEAADALKGRIAVRRADFPAAGEGKVWAADLIGCKAVNKDGVELGEITGIDNNGAQDLFVVTWTAGDGHRAEFLIPAVKDVYLIEAQPEDGRVVVDWAPEWR